MEPPTVTLVGAIVAANFYILLTPQDDLLNFHQFHFRTGETETSTSNNIPEDYDDLGFYEDGSKRTLTDEQIAMFRHSEIQQMIKQHNATEEDSESLSQIADTLTTQKPEPQQQQRKRKRKTEPSNGERRDVNLFTAEGETRTFRRIAREMDEVKQQHVELDY